MQKPILFFDGVCGLCNHFVNFLFKIDTNSLFNVAALQGETAQQLLPNALTTELKTLVVYENEIIHTKSDAVIYILLTVGRHWKILGILASIFPRVVRNWAYDFIAVRRYKFFGKHDTCRLPTKEETKRFLK